AQRELLEDNDVLRFTVVRNPYTRFVSAWRDKVYLYEPTAEDVYVAVRRAGRRPQTAHSVCGVRRARRADDQRKHRPALASPGRPHLSRRHWLYAHRQDRESSGDDRIAVSTRRARTAADDAARKRCGASCRCVVHTVARSTRARHLRTGFRRVRLRSG